MVSKDNSFLLSNYSTVPSDFQLFCRFLSVCLWAMYGIMSDKGAIYNG